MNTKFITGIIITILLLSVSGCTEAELGTTSSDEVIKSSKYFWPGQYWVEVAQAKGFFEEAGLNIELVDTNEDYEGSLQDMIDGKMDINHFTLYAFMKAVANGEDLVAVIPTDKSNGAESILSTKEIETIQDLAGKKVGVQKDSYLNYILTSVLEANNVLSEDVERVEVIGEKAGEGLINGQYDAIIMWEPILSEAKEAIDGNILYDTSSTEPVVSPSVVVFHRSFVEERPEDIQAFVNVWAKTTEYMKENQDEAYTIIAENYGVTIEDVAAFAEVDSILDLDENQVILSYGSGEESLYNNAVDVNNFLIEHGFSEEKVDVTKHITAEFVNGVGA
jgi:NitT/TauT family transport system substrate-binding protein